MDDKLIQKFSQTQSDIAETEAKIMEQTTALQTKLATLKKIDTEIRGNIKEAMEKYDVKKFENDNLAITYIAPTTRTGLDTGRLKEEQPTLYEEYKKVSPVKSSVRIKVKGDNQ